MKVLALLPLLLVVSEPVPDQVNPHPREVIDEQQLATFSFEEGTAGWIAQNQCSIRAEGGALLVDSTGDDPYMVRPVDLPGGEVALRITARSRTAGAGSVYFITDRAPHWGEDKSVHFDMEPDGRWHTYTARFVADGRLTGLRVDPAVSPGRTEIRHIELVSKQYHPLEIVYVEAGGEQLRAAVRNHGSDALPVSVLGTTHTLGGGQTRFFGAPLSLEGPLTAFEVTAEAADLPPLPRTLLVADPAAEADWIERPLGGFTLQVAPDGAAARIRRQGETLAMLAPLVAREGRPVRLERRDASSSAAAFRGEGVEVELVVEGDALRVRIEAEDDCEGPFVRAFGGLEQGLLAGLEYLGKGEASSSDLDIETDDRFRFAPDPLLVTMPLAAFVTDGATVALSWDDMDLAPTYATPNFFDGTADHRMGLRGRSIEATVRVAEEGLEEAILWAVRRQGLPLLPEAPRTVEEQTELTLAALRGPLRNEDGWGHCVQPNWDRQPFADVASVYWRLTGEVPEFPRLVPGGSHVRNDAAFFVSGRAEQWLHTRRGEAENLLRQQRPDGSFRYQGKYLRGHFEDTASGYCARPAAMLLEFARLTGDRQALEAGLETLEFMKRFRTPRGAQTWELSLHTPDLLASAWLVKAYLRGYQLTGEEAYLGEARRWALTGVPFIYLWDRHPVQRYASIAVYGATDYRAPLWIGQPVQWVGGVYAYALAELAPYDDTLDWAHLARGILLSAEQQQYPDGEYVGLLPDAFALRSQHRRPPDINPAAIATLRIKLDGQLDTLDLATEGEHRIVSPFPVTLRDGVAEIEAVAGTAYQVVVDGARIVDVVSEGRDRVPVK